MSVLLKRAATGDRESCAALVERVDPLLLLYARRQLAPPLDARFDPADIVNDAWARMLRASATSSRRTAASRARCSSTRPPSSTTACEISRADIARSRRRRAPARARRATRRAASTPPTTPPGSSPPSRGAKSPSASARSSTSCRHRDREIVLLRGIGQQTNDEVAELLDVRPGHGRRQVPPGARPAQEAPPMSAFDDLFTEDA